MEYETSLSVLAVSSAIGSASVNAPRVAWEPLNLPLSRWIPVPQVRIAIPTSASVTAVILLCGVSAQLPE